MGELMSDEESLAAFPLNVGSEMYGVMQTWRRGDPFGQMAW